MSTNRKAAKAKKPGLRKQTIKDLDPKEKGAAVKGGATIKGINVGDVVNKAIGRRTAM